MDKVADFPEFTYEHVWTETIIVLKNHQGEYGRIVALYPTAADGSPDYSGDRQPSFRGHLRIIGTLANGQQVMIPLEFPIPEADPMRAAATFSHYGRLASEEYRKEAFKRTLLGQDGRPQ